MSDDRYEVITWRGHKFDKFTVAAIEAAEELLGHRLEVMQGSYNKGKVTESAGTHDGGGAVDFAATGLVKRDVRVLRSVGFAAWHRTAEQGPWGPHIHAVLIGNEKASASAKRQVSAYLAGRDGLASNARDNTWRPTPVPTFAYPEDPMQQLLTDLRALAKKHGVSLLYLARVALFGTSSTKGSPRFIAVRSARALLKPFK